MNDEHVIQEEEENILMKIVYTVLVASNNSRENR